MAGVDLTGRWGVVMQSFFFGSVPMEWDFEQTGTHIVLTITFTGPTFSSFTPPTLHA
jgi:hypothetical protein